MATMLLQYAGGLAGGLIGGPVGAVLGRTIGGLAGAAIDQSLFGKPIQGPRLENLTVLSSSEGAAIPALWGRARIAGQVIWAAPITEHKNKKKAGGKGGPSITEYSYTASFAIGLCEGPISRIGRMWADGNEIDASRFAIRLYKGSENQKPDSLIAALEGEAPAYRGLAYVVFTDLPLGPFGNRIPQLSFEVFRSAGGLADKVQAMCIIPGAGEFVYDTEPVSVDKGPGRAESENRHVSAKKTDWTHSLDQLQAACPNVSSAGLVVAWFGSSLDAGNCLVEPAVDNRAKVTRPIQWSVAGRTRANAKLVSQIDGRAAYGGTPADVSVVRAIADLKRRGIKSVFYPFILMDIPPGNAGGEPAYPWRGEIAPKTQADVARFFGAPNPDGWNYSRMVLHYARLCASAGGVDAFLIGSELRGLTRFRAPDGSFPAVAELMRLALEVKKILPAAKISYAADWSEYGGFMPQASNDLCFPLDPLWASPDIDFIGIDNYFPLSDWRDGSDHLDAKAGFAGLADGAYLAANVEGGEYFDWYYASGADRDSQTRSPISDGAYGKAWVWRAKDIRGWWLNAHVERRNGVELTAPTPWVPRSKPIWFTEAGCPAVDKGSNAPHVFPDAKSSAAGLPWFSNGSRDDDMQRLHLSTLLDYWQDAAINPVSPLYGGRMVNVSRCHLWCWDARPWPAFPHLQSVWSDGANHARGHWLNGRLDNAPVADVIASVLAHYGIADADIAGLRGTMDGFLISDPASARDALEPLLEAFGIDAAESAGALSFRMRGSGKVLVLRDDELVELDAEKPLKRFSRMAADGMPAALRIGFCDPARDYQPAAVEARRRTSQTTREVALNLGAVVSSAQAEARAAGLLQDSWAQRENAEFTLPPSRLDIEPGDSIALEGLAGIQRVTGLSGLAARRATSVGVEASIFDPANAIEREQGFAPIAMPVPPRVEALDLPLPEGLRIAAAAEPWAESLALLRMQAEASYRTLSAIRVPATMGVTLDALPAGPVWRRDRINRVRIELTAGALASVSLEEMLGGANRAAIGNAEMGWEIVQFSSAILVAPDTYELSGLLRGQAGSEALAEMGKPAGCSFVLLDEALADAEAGLDDIGRRLEWRAGAITRDMADEGWTSVAITYGARALRPMRPVHLCARLSGSAMRLSWIRRTRASGDSWELAEVPLGEDSEVYSLQICRNDGSLLRQVQVVAPCFQYANADRLNDLGSLRVPFLVRVAQLGSAYGPGPYAEMMVNG